MTRDPQSPASAQPEPPSTPASIPAGRPALLPQRTALILFISVAVGVGIGVLTYFANRSYPGAVLAGVFATAACTKGLDSLIS